MYVGDPLASIFNWRPLSDDSSSDGCFTIASKWLKKCLDTHNECPKQLSPLPTRVVDVGDESQDPFLHISRGKSGTWLSLSHCWGKEQTFTTTLDTLDQRCKSLPMNDLPGTYRDAISITRRLGYQYLWIDSLCIIQDSKEDWEVEAQKMAMIYQNALVTISADASENDHQGIFRGAKSLRNKSDSFALSCHSSKRGVAGNIYVDRRNAKPKHYNLEIMPLQTRAWVLQEKALSIRKLHYNGSGLTWECQMMTSKEITPWIQQRNLSAKELHNIPITPIPSCLDFGNPDPRYGDTGSLAWWYLQVNDYMKRRLTFKKDRFPAISGLAKEFSRRTGYHYSAGIWLEDFQRGLLWKGAKSIEYLDFSPSWSWASADFNEWAGRANATNSFLKHGNSRGVELVKVSVPATRDEFLAPGMPMVLTLRGWCKDIRDFRTTGQFYPSPSTWAIFNQPEPPGPRYLQFRASPPSQNPSDEETVIFWPDFAIDAASAQTSLEEKGAIVMGIADFETWDTGNRHLAISSTWALLLEPTGEVDGIYRRIGLVRIPSLNHMATIDGFEQRTVSIV